MSTRRDAFACDAEEKRLCDAWAELSFIARFAFCVAVPQNRDDSEDMVCPDALLLDLLEYELQSPGEIQYCTAGGETARLHVM